LDNDSSSQIQFAKSEVDKPSSYNRPLLTSQSLTEMSNLVLELDNNLNPDCCNEKEEELHKDPVMPDVCHTM
jgi:hypothetical protein